MLQISEAFVESAQSPGLYAYTLVVQRVGGHCHAVRWPVEMRDLRLCETIRLRLRAKALAAFASMGVGCAALAA